MVTATRNYYLVLFIGVRGKTGKEMAPKPGADRHPVLGQKIDVFGSGVTGGKDRSKIRYPMADLRPHALRGGAAPQPHC